MQGDCCPEGMEWTLQRPRTAGASQQEQVETTAERKVSRHSHSVSAFRSLTSLKPGFGTAPSDCPSGYHDIGTRPLAHIFIGETLQNNLLHVLEAPSPAAGPARAGGSLKVCDSTFRTELEVHPYRDGFGGLCSANVQIQRWQYDAGINGHASNHLEQTQFVTNKGHTCAAAWMWQHRAPTYLLVGWSRDQPKMRAPCCIGWSGEPTKWCAHRPNWLVTNLDGGKCVLCWSQTEFVPSDRQHGH